uniref:Neurotransmitter-gated ion-channel ligand-binding domain-containing protein n=1 Tax=Romanomermis culicivorax TaxID=13658 RepID=A0A915I7N1_ROMCU
MSMSRSGATLQDIEQLYEDTFYSYNKISRPNRNASDMIVIRFSAFLLRIVDVDERNQILTVSLWIEMMDISYFPYDQQTCKLKFGGWSHDGYVLDLRQVPGSQKLMNITEPDDGKPGLFMMRGMDLSYYDKGAEWDLLNLTSTRHERIYPGCCGQAYYIDITYKITIRRQALFFTINLVIPCMLIAFLTTFVFYVTDHKVTFAISILVALSVFFLVLIGRLQTGLIKWSDCLKSIYRKTARVNGTECRMSQKSCLKWYWFIERKELIPPNSVHVALFGQYLLFTMFLVSTSIVSTIVILNIYHRDSSTHRMPKWVRILFLNYLPRMLRMKVPDWHKVDPKLEEIKKLIRKNLSYNERFRGSFNRRPSPYFMSVDELDQEKRLTRLALANGMHPVIIQEMINNVNAIANHFATLEENSK